MGISNKSGKRSKVDQGLPQEWPRLPCWSENSFYGIIYDKTCDSASFVTCQIYYF
ncbi:unnamed protein product [Moneuplotes crassus]|uniref:Uncharacterized protein n=1 Tax=Euplotes crassus TaxID=5936 RepID=A0AAD1X618_EUPCR|nr:unnamed protein product [Moneuplotes crassus]